MTREDFEIQLMDTTAYSGECFNCNEDIDRTDGPKYVQIRVPKQKNLLFHSDCYLYFLTALLKFREVFIDEPQEEMQWIN